MAKRGLNRLNPKKLAADAAHTAHGATWGAIGSMGGVLGSDPQREVVPAYQYGKENKAFGRGYNVTSAPGSAIARGYKKVLRKK